MNLLLPLSLLGVFIVSGCGTVPRDARDTTEKIRSSRVLRVGLSHEDNVPAIVRAAERQTIERLAKRLGARVEYERGNAHLLLQELEEGHLPLVAAGLPSDTPFAGSVGTSLPYLQKGPDEKDYVIAVSPGENRLQLLLDQVIAEARKESGA